MNWVTLIIVAYLMIGSMISNVVEHVSHVQKDGADLNTSLMGVAAAGWLTAALWPLLVLWLGYGALLDKAESRSASRRP